MQALLAPLKELAEYDEIRKIVRQGKGTIALSGCVDSQKLHMIYGLSDGLKYKVIVTYNDLKAKEIYEEYRFYDRNVMLYPAKDLIFFQADIHGNQLVQERIKTLRRVVEGKPVTIVTTYAALMTPQVLWQEQDIIRTERGGSWMRADWHPDWWQWDMRRHTRWKARDSSPSAAASWTFLI